MPEELLSVEKVAEAMTSRLGESVPLRTVRWWCKEGYLAGAQKVGRDWVIPAKSLKSFKPPERGRPPKKVAENG